LGHSSWTFFNAFTLTFMRESRVSISASSAAAAASAAAFGA
jgi:hypothetical protein